MPDFGPKPNPTPEQIAERAAEVRGASGPPRRAAGTCRYTRYCGTPEPEQSAAAGARRAIEEYRRACPRRRREDGPCPATTTPPNPGGGNAG